MRCPSSDCVPLADRLVTVRLRLGRNVASSSSLSDSASSEEDSEEVTPAERKSGAVELRVGGPRVTGRRGCDPVLGAGGGVPSVDERL